MLQRIDQAVDTTTMSFRDHSAARRGRSAALGEVVDRLRREVLSLRRGWGGLQQLLAALHSR